MTHDFGGRLRATFDTAGHLCVGIDPHPYLLEKWGLGDSAEGLREFGLRSVDAVAGRAGIVKPQVAFFERHGSRGYAALEDTLAAARAAGLLVIADVKRGDLGTSVESYAQAWLTPGSSLEVDAMTIAAYQGVGSLAAPIELAQREGKGLFVLAATSNPEAFEIQTARIVTGENRDRTVAASIVAEVSKGNNTGSSSADAVAKDLGSLGVVIGATVSLTDFGLAPTDLVPSGLVPTPVLVPGFGFQGAGFDEIGALFGDAAANIIVSSSRAILLAGPDGMAAAVSSQVRDLAGSFA
jgi:orotidine-5'-phosphate decarboxylase